MSNSSNALTADRLRQLLRYEPETGLFTWIKPPKGRVCPGEVAGCITARGRRVISIDGRQHKAARLAWLYCTGENPSGVIDHRDHNTLNDAIGNLRDLSVAANTQNQIKGGRRNRSGFIGVYLSEGRWRSKLVAHGVRYDLGSFNAPEAAHAAYIEAKRIHHEGNTL